MVVCSRYVLKKCHYYIDQSNYCENCKRTSIFVENVDKIDSVGRMYDDKLNKDCVIAFLTVHDDDANMNTAVNTMIGIACTIPRNVLPSHTCNVPEYINNIMQDGFHYHLLSIWILLLIIVRDVLLVD